MNCYEDIIHLPHPVSGKHPQMSMHDRAAQFSPFAALTGHKEAVQETARRTEAETIPDDSEIAELNRKLLFLKQHPQEISAVQITWFRRDARKPGGEYLTSAAPVRRIDENSRTVVLEDGTVIPMQHIRSIEILS